MKAWIHGEETFPDYQVDEPAGVDASDWEKAYRGRMTYEVDDETLARWRHAAALYDIVQNEIREFVNSKWENGKRVDL